VLIQQQQQQQNGARPGVREQEILPVSYTRHWTEEEEGDSLASENEDDHEEEVIIDSSSDEDKVVDLTGHSSGEDMEPNVHDVVEMPPQHQQPLAVQNRDVPPAQHQQQKRSLARDTRATPALKKSQTVQQSIMNFITVATSNNNVAVAPSASVSICSIALAI
jgi:hypothetical protein